MYPEVEVTAVDTVPGPGILLADLRHPVRPHGIFGQFDWVLAAHLLNELAKTHSPDSLSRLVEFWGVEWLAPDGVLILLEPALRETSRGLLQVRDRLIDRGFTILAPCLFSGPCPALKRERDFCHDSAPAIVANRSRVDFSYMVFRRHAPTKQSPLRYRVVSDAMKDKGRLRFFVCGDLGRQLVTRLDRDRSLANQDFDQLVRGELTSIENGVVTGDGLRLLRESVIRRLE
jgi:hypothetical protein